MYFDLIEKSLIYQYEISRGYWDKYEEYFFYDFEKTLKHFNLEIEDLVFILKTAYSSKYNVIFEASILFNVKETMIASNVCLTYIPKEIMN